MVEKFGFAVLPRKGFPPFFGLQLILTPDSESLHTERDVQNLEHKKT